MHPLLADPWVAARIDAAVAPYRGLLSSTDLDFLREAMAEQLATDEHAARVLRRAAPRHVDESGEAFVGVPSAGEAPPALRPDGAVRPRRAGASE